MKSKSLLAPVLMAFGFIVGVPALGDDVSSDSGSVTDAVIAVTVVDIPSDEMTVCVTLPTVDQPIPCTISADGSTLASVTLESGDNYVLVPVVDPDVIGVTTMPSNDGVN
jgi:hypothetical protein